jgi:hypothetical protein
MTRERATPPVGRRWALVPSADFYVGANGTPYRLNADLKCHPRVGFAANTTFSILARIHFPI